MDFRTTIETPLRDEEEVKKFKESQEVLEKLFYWLFGVIAFKATAEGRDFSTEHPIVMMAIFLMLMLYFLAWLLGTMLRRRRVECRWLMMILVWIVLVTGSVSSVLLSVIISPPVAWFASLLWVAIFSVTAYYYYQLLCELFVCSVSNALAKLIESYRRQSTRLPV